MINYRVLRFFIDRESLKEFNAGDLFPCSDSKRADELIYKGYIIAEPVEEPTKADDKQEDKKPKTAKANSTAKRTVKKKA